MMTVETAKLSAAISTALRAVRSSPMPILNCVHVQADPSTKMLHVTGTDLDKRITAIVRVDTIAEELNFCVGARGLSSIVNALSGDTVSITQSKTKIKLKAPPSDFSLYSISPEEYPPIMPVPQKWGTVKQAWLRAVMNAIKPAASTDESRAVLNGSYFKAENGTFVGAATDGRRLHVIEKKCEGLSGAEGIIVPSKAIQSVVGSLATEGDLDAHVHANERSFYVDIPGPEGGVSVWVWTKLVSGQYPSYERVIPKYAHRGLIVPREELLGACRRVALVTDERSSAIKFEIEDATLTIHGSSPSNGTASETVFCENPDRLKGHFAMNCQYMVDALSAVQAQSIVMNANLNEPSVAAVTVSAKDEGFLSVLMPVRIS